MSALSKYKTYPEYKDSGIEWLGEIPKHWEPVKLKHIVTLSNQKATNLTDHQYVGMENIESKTAKYITTENIIPEGVSNQFKKGDILFGKLRPYLAKAWLATFSGVCSSELLVLKNHKLFSDFLKSYLLTNNVINEINSSTYGSKMPRASWNFIGQIPVPFMPYEESKKIAQFLDHETAKIDQLIEKQQTLIELLKEKRQAVISHAVTKGLDPNVKMKDSGIEWLGEVPEHWNISRLGFESLIKARLGWKGLRAEEYVEQGYIFLATPNIKSGDIDFENVNYITQKRYEESPEIMLKKGDVLVTKDGSTTGTTNIVRNLPSPATVNSSIAVIRPQSSLHSEYLYYYFISPYTQNVIKRMQGGMGVPHLFQADLRVFNLILPPTQEQIEIATYLDNRTSKIDLLIQKAEQQIELMKERRTALISAAVKGKIDVRDWQPEQ